MAEAKPLTHIEMLELDRVPEHLIVSRAAGMWDWSSRRRIGGLAARVEIIQRGAQLLPGYDADVVAEITRILTAEGTTILTSAEVVGVSGRSGDRVIAHVRTNAGTTVIEASDILASTERTLITRHLGWAWRRRVTEANRLSSR